MRSCFHFASRAIITAFVFCILCAVTGAQSGRRPPKKTDPPAPVQPPSEKEPEAKPSNTEAKPEAPRTPVMATKYVSGIGDETIYSNMMLRACLDRLEKSRGLNVTASQEDKNRKQASDYARDSSIHVVWVELHFTSRYDRTNTRQTNTDSFYVDYSLFEPATGKSKTNGRIYQRPYRQGTVGPVPVPGSYTSIESYIRQAGEDVADRIMSALNITLPPDR